MHRQHVAPSPIQPREDDHVVADVEVLERLADARVEPDGRDGCALVALSRGGGQVDQRRLDPSDLAKLEAGGGHGSILPDRRGSEA